MVKKVRTKRGRNNGERKRSDVDGKGGLRDERKRGIGRVRKNG